MATAKLCVFPTAAFVSLRKRTLAPAQGAFEVKIQAGSGAMWITSQPCDNALLK